MKKQTNKAWMGAIALACTMGFTACSSDDDKIENINPTFDGNNVKTQFAINIPRAKQSRQSDAITQQNGTFRGMDNIQLIPLTLDGDVESTTTFDDGIITLNDIAKTEVSTSDGQKVYEDVDVPIGTNNFLFYGQATRENTATEATDGALTAPTWTSLTTTSTADEITFALKQIHNETLTDASLLHILNSLTGIEAWQNSDNANLRTALTNIENLTAGSSNSILRAVEKLYKVVANGQENTTDPESATHIAYLIKTEIEKFFTATETNGAYTLAYKESYESNDGTTTINNEFPTSLGLPEGAARLTCSNHVFNYVTTEIGGANTDNKVSVSSITYPAALYYYANTTLKASDNADATPDWANGTWIGWDNAVKATTRYIALKDKINYGVGLLTTNVKLNGTTLNDSKNTAITVTGNNTSLKYTGLLIGGQPSQVGWNFEAADGEAFSQTIYDGSMNSDDVLSTANVTNYTLVLDNAGSVTTDGQSTPNSVNIAIELENNTGTEFHGADGVVANGAKFYLVAKLDPTATTGVTKPTGDTNVDRVFLKDYETTVNLTIKDLKNAYVTIPDLRATQLKLGLYVDLSWSTGMKFDVSIGE